MTNDPTLEPALIEFVVDDPALDADRNQLKVIQNDPDRLRLFRLLFVLLRLNSKPAVLFGKLYELALRGNEVRV